MKKQLLTLMGMFVLLVAAMATSVPAFAKERVVFSGGPAGGTFQVVANAIQVYKPMKASKDFRVRAQSSAGSVENLRKVIRARRKWAWFIQATFISAATAG
jgi:TRAP-type uncharacterized transport system substrate-binding protein